MTYTGYVPNLPAKVYDYFLKPEEEWSIAEKLIWGVTGFLTDYQVLSMGLEAAGLPRLRYGVPASKYMIRYAGHMRWVSPIISRLPLPRMSMPATAKLYPVTKPVLKPTVRPYPLTQSGWIARGGVLRPPAGPLGAIWLLPLFLPTMERLTAEPTDPMGQPIAY